MQISLKKILSEIKVQEADWIGLRHVLEKTTVRAARDEKPQSNDSFESQGAMIEVLCRGQFGYACTPNMEPASIQMAAERACKQALNSSRFSIHKFSLDQRPPAKADFRLPVLRPPDSMTAAEQNARLIEITKRLKISNDIVRATAAVQTVETGVHFVSTNGAEAFQDQVFITVSFASTARKGSVIQRRSEGGIGGRSQQGGWENFPDDHLWARVQKISEQALELVQADECPAEISDLILMPDQMMLQIHESVGHPLEMDRILGDERNYAGWSFVNESDFGKLQYGSKIMNITFDPTLKNEFASYAFDDNGCMATREFIVKDGVLVRALGGLESQARSNIEGVANARASSWNRAPIDRMANLNLEPGTSTFKDIVSSTKRGIIMESNRSWSIDDFRNKFQFGCEYAKLVEDGRVTKTLRNPNYRGVTVPFWRNLKKVGDASTFEVCGVPTCGKGEPNQLVRVGHASPVCLFENVEVFGGV